MEYKAEMLIEVLGTLDQDTADLVGLALILGQTNSGFIEDMLERKMIEAIDYLETLKDEEDYDCSVCNLEDEDCYCVQEESDDGYCELLEDEAVEEEAFPEPEPDLLSEKLGLDVDSSTPINLANRIVYLSRGDEATQMSLIKELAARGKSLAQLSTLVEGL